MKPEAKPVPIAEPEPQKATPPATLLLRAGTMNWAYVRIDGKRHLIEPNKSGVKLRPGAHSVYVSQDPEGKKDFKRAGKIEVSSSSEYELRLRKDPLGLSLKRKN